MACTPPHLQRTELVIRTKNTDGTTPGSNHIFIHRNRQKTNGHTNRNFCGFGMRDTVLAAVLVTVSVWSLRPVGGSDAEVVRIKPTAAVTASVALAAEGRGSGDQSASAASNNGTSPCDRHLRSAEVEVRNPRNHKFVTSNGWADRQRPRPEINVYPRVEEQPSPQTPLSTAAATAAYYQQQRESYYQQHSSHPQNQQQPPSVRTSKRIIYYATLPDVVRPPPQQSGHPTADPYALGPGPFSADFRQLDRCVLIHFNIFTSLSIAYAATVSKCCLRKKFLRHIYST